MLQVYIVYFGGRPDDRQAAAQTQQDVLSKWLVPLYTKLCCFLQNSVGY